MERIIMRIEAYNQVQQIYQAQRVNKNTKVQGAGKTDQVSISSIGRDFQMAKSAVMSSPDIREELVAPIRTKIQNGTYEVSAGSFAEKLLQKCEEMR